MMYYSVTTGFRSGGYNLVFFSNSPTYKPEELVAYEIGYKTQWFDDSLQINGSFYYYDYSEDPHHRERSDHPGRNHDLCAGCAGCRYLRHRR